MQTFVAFSIALHTSPLIVGSKRPVAGHDFDSQAFTASAAHMHGVKFAALDTLQHRLTRDAESLGGFEHRHVIRWGLYEPRTQFIGDANAPRRARRELFTSDEAVVEPAMKRAKGDAEDRGRVLEC